MILLCSVVVGFHLFTLIYPPVWPSQGLKILVCNTLTKNLVQGNIRGSSLNNLILQFSSRVLYKGAIDFLNHFEGFLSPFCHPLAGELPRGIGCN